MHLEKPVLANVFKDKSLQGYSRLSKLFFAPSESSQSAGAAFVARLQLRKEDLDPVSGAQVAQAQVAAFRDWERFAGERFADLRIIRHPTLVVHGIDDEMIPVSNVYWLSRHLCTASPGHSSVFEGMQAQYEPPPIT